MAKFVEWDDVESPKKGGSRSGGDNSGKFLKLEANKEYTLRPLFKPIGFHKYFNKKDGQFRTAIVEDPDKDTVRQKYSQLKRAQDKRAFLAFWREGGNRLKVVELPASATEAFKHFKKVAKAEPGGPDGGDFLLKVICPNGVKDRDTTYEIEFVEKKPFTEDERKFVMENVKGKEEWDLEKMFAPQSPEEIEKRLFGDWQPPKKNRDGEQQQQSSNSGSKDDDTMFGASSGAGKPSNSSTKSAEENDPFKF